MSDFPLAETVPDPAEVAAFEDFLNHWEPQLRRVMFGYCHDAAFMDDVVYYAAERAWHDWENVRRHPVPLAWLILTAKRRLYRLHARLPAGEDLTAPDELPRVAGGRDDFADIDLAIDLAKDLGAAMEQLTANQREAFVLTHFAGLNSTEAAPVMGMAPATVRRHFANARSRLEELLDDTYRRNR